MAHKLRKDGFMTTDRHDDKATDDSPYWSLVASFLTPPSLAALSVASPHTRSAVRRSGGWKHSALARFPRLRGIIQLEEGNAIGDWARLYKDQLIAERRPLPRGDVRVDQDALRPRLESMVATIELALVAEPPDGGDDMRFRPMELPILSRSVRPDVGAGEVVFEPLWTTESLPPLFAWYLRANHCQSDEEFARLFPWIICDDHLTFPSKVSAYFLDLVADDLPVATDVWLRCQHRLRLRLYVTKHFHTVKVYDGEVDDYDRRRLYFEYKDVPSKNPFYNDHIMVASHVILAESGRAGLSLLMKEHGFTYDALAHLWWFVDIVEDKQLL